jgi:hypothetical protein
MDSKRKIDALTETSKFIGKTFRRAEALKMGALAKARQLIVDHPVQFKSGKIYIAIVRINITNEHGVV